MLKVSHFIPGSAGWDSHLTQESKYFGQLSWKNFNNFCHFSCPQKFINNLFQHPDTNPVLLNKMPLNHHAPIGRTSCCFTHITITPWGKNIFLILPVSFKLPCGVAFAFIQDHLLLLLRVKCYLSSVTPHSSDRRSKIRFMIIKPSQSHNYIIKSVGESDKLTIWGTALHFLWHVCFQQWSLNSPL